MSCTDPSHNHEDHAVVVGIDDYEGDFVPLQGARNDAQHFCDWLLSPDGGRLCPANVVLILSDGGAGQWTPTKDQVEDALHAHILRFFATKKRERRIYLYMSGHGAAPASTEIEDCVLLMANATGHTLGRNIPGPRIAHGYRVGLVFDEVVLFMDCCRQLVTARAKVDFTFEDDLEKLQLESTGTAACVYGFATAMRTEAREQSLPRPAGPGSLPQGRFTYALLDGLRRGADAKGEVTAASLDAYVKKLLAKLSGGAEPQIPKITGEGELILVKVAEPRTRVLVSLHPPLATFTVIDGMTLQPVADQRIALETDLFEMKLRPGLYGFNYVDAQGAARLSRVEVVGEEVHVEL